MTPRTRVQVGAAVLAALLWGAPSMRAQTTASPSPAGDRAAVRVTLEALETDAARYSGQTVMVDAEVDSVFGPRLFTIDARDWADLGGELLVVVPSALAAGVREHDQVTVTGTVTPFAKADLEKEWGWLPLDAHGEARMGSKPVLVATKIQHARRELVLLLPAAPGPTPSSQIPPTPVGSARRDQTPGDVTLSDASRVALSTEVVVGRRVDLEGLAVTSVSPRGGFFVNAGTGQLFVLPAGSYTPAIGDRVDLQGVLLRMPTRMQAELDAPAQANGDIYVFASTVTKR